MLVLSSRRHSTNQIKKKSSKFDGTSDARKIVIRRFDRLHKKRAIETKNRFEFDKNRQNDSHK